MAALAPDHPVVVTREWPWGLAFIGDSAWSERVPVDWLKDDPMFASDGEIVVKIQHQVDGEASVEVGLEEPTGCSLLRRVELEIPSGRLFVADAGLERVDEVSLPAGHWQATVWVDRTEKPSRVVVSLRQ